MRILAACRSAVLLNDGVQLPSGLVKQSGPAGIWNERAALKLAGLLRFDSQQPKSGWPVILGQGGFSYIAQGSMQGHGKVAIKLLRVNPGLADHHSWAQVSLVNVWRVRVRLPVCFSLSLLPFPRWFKPGDTNPMVQTTVAATGTGI